MKNINGIMIQTSHSIIDLGFIILASKTCNRCENVTWQIILFRNLNNFTRNQITRIFSKNENISSIVKEFRIVHSVKLWTPMIFQWHKQMLQIFIIWSSMDSHAIIGSFFILRKLGLRWYEIRGGQSKIILFMRFMGSWSSKTFHGDSFQVNLINTEIYSSLIENGNALISANYEC